MSIDYVYSVIYNFLITNQLITLGLLIVLALFLWKKPWEFFKSVVMILVLIAGFYVVTQLSQSTNFGVKQKHSITTEREDEVTERQGKLFGN
jgi:Ca2+/Na+ antiporter